VALDSYTIKPQSRAQADEWRNTTFLEQEKI